MHAYKAAKAILERFGIDEEPEGLDGVWIADCRGVPTPQGPVCLSAQLSDPDECREAEELLLLDTMSASPQKRGGGRMLLEALADYCRPSRVRLSFHALDGTEGFYRKFPWLREDPPGSGEFRSSW